MGHSLLPRSRRARALTAIAICGLAAAAGLHDGALYLLPALVLLGTLALGRYPGERVLLALAVRRARRARRRRAVGASASAAPARALIPRGGLLLASFLAVRPPPPAGCVQR